MHEFNALPYREKLRVRKYLRRGEAPEDPRLAVAAVELAESYRRQRYTLVGWVAVLLFVTNTYLAISAAIDGDQVRWMLNAAVAVGWVGIALTEPVLRPKSMARSLEASRRIAAAGAP